MSEKYTGDNWSLFSNWLYFHHVSYQKLIMSRTGDDLLHYFFEGQIFIGRHYSRLSAKLEWERERERKKEKNNSQSISKTTFHYELVSFRLAVGSKWSQFIWWSLAVCDCHTGNYNWCNKMDQYYVICLRKFRTEIKFLLERDPLLVLILSQSEFLYRSTFPEVNSGISIGIRAT